VIMARNSSVSVLSDESGRILGVFSRYSDIPRVLGITDKELETACWNLVYSIHTYQLGKLQEVIPKQPCRFKLDMTPKPYPNTRDYPEK